MRPLVLLREAVATARASRVPTALVAVLTAVMVAATLVTVGRSAQAEAVVLARMEAAGSRVLTVATRSRSELLPGAVVSQVAGLSVVERAVGLTFPDDVRNTAVPGGGGVPAWQVVGDVAAVAELVAGRWPGPGEALVAASAQAVLGMSDPAGSITESGAAGTGEWPVVGSFVPREPFADLGAGVVVAAESRVVADTLHVVLVRASDARLAQNLVVGLIEPLDPGDISVESPVGLADLQEQVAGDLGSYGRSLLVGVLGVGAVLIAVVVLADVLVRRSDLGRRRALGATRQSVMLLVLLRTALPAVAGALLGLGVGLVVTQRLGGLPPADFVAGTAVLASLAASASALPPAAYAATRDPVRVLRTP